MCHFVGDREIVHGVEVFEAYGALHRPIVSRRGVVLRGLVDARRALSWGDDRAPEDRFLPRGEERGFVIFEAF